MRRSRLVIIALVALFLNSLPNASHALSHPACSISGTVFADRIVGTPGDDVICAQAGNDNINIFHEALPRGYFGCGKLPGIAFL